jgi:Serine/Threonine/Tyrosine Kinase found in polyvalent proteins
VEDSKSFKHELQHIISGDDATGQSRLIKATQTYLKTSYLTGSKVEGYQFTRTEQERALILYATENNLWTDEKTFGTYITEGAEQKVFFPENADYVVKLADAIFYLNWADYFNNLLLHNALFPTTAYELIGYYRNAGKLFAVLKQPFIKADELTNLENVKQFLSANGFKLSKNNDYYHPFLGIILEDLHDENVLTNEGVLFFVDTVIYLTESFYT